MTPSRPLLVVILAFALGGCDPFAGPESLMDEYVARTARVLDLEAQLAVPAPVPSLPRRRLRQLEVPSLQIDMLDFLSLYGCQLQFVVGERNSVLGRVMQPLNRLRYELRFIQAARDCVPEIDNEELAQSVAEAADSKEQSLPFVIWNATWGVEEVEPLFTRSKGYLPVDSTGVTTASLGQGVTRLNRTIEAILGGQLGQDLGFVGAMHQQWQSQHRAGQVLNSATLVTARLEDVADLIVQRLDGRPLCIGGRENEQARIVQSMFFSVYIKEVQPYLADIRRARNELMEPLSELASLQAEVMPKAFEEFHDEALGVDGEGIWQRLDQATDRHTSAWQDLLDQCGMRPSA